MSEVARLRQQLELESQAMKRLMNGFAVTASHEIINNKYRVLGKIHDELATIVGEKEATEITVTIYTDIVG